MKQFISHHLSTLQKGESVRDIIFYWFPELISATILIALPPLIDSYLVSNSNTIVSYGAVAVVTNLLYTLIKLGEAIPVAAISIIGRLNGAQRYEKCGEELGNTFWITTIFGLAQFLIILCTARFVFFLLDVPQEIAEIGIPFLKWKSFGIFLMFILLSFIGFMRAIKNTTMPMMINMIGIVVFIFFDYVLILGKFGFPKLNIYGSAFASIIQYLIMNIIAIAYILLNPDYKKYFKQIFFSFFNLKQALHMLNLSWPIIIDKTIFAVCYIWLTKMIVPLGNHVIATYDVVKNLERLAFIPAIAFAQVITFLVSNYLGSQDPEGASTNLKKILMLTAVTVSGTLLLISWKANFLVSLYDPGKQFTDLAATSFIIISLFVFFDYIQVILAGALRGAGDVRTVMIGRILPCLFVFAPLSYLFRHLPLTNVCTKFILIYASYYISTGIMSLIFLQRIKSHKWHDKKLS